MSLLKLLFVTRCHFLSSGLPDYARLWIPQTPGKRHFWQSYPGKREGHRTLLCHEDPKEGGDRSKSECMPIRKRKDTAEGQRSTWLIPKWLPIVRVAQTLFIAFFFSGWSGAHTHREQSPPKFKASILDSKEPLHIPKPNLILTHRDPREPLQSNPAASIQEKKRGGVTFLPGMFWRAVFTKTAVQLGLL